MTDKSEHLAALEHIRDTLLEARRDYAAAGNGKEVVDYQIKFEAIERAIEDEKKRGPHKVRSGALGL